MNTIIVTGGLGFIGSNLIKILNKKKFFVINIDKVSYASNFKNIPENIKNYKFYKEDILELLMLLYTLNLSKGIILFTGYSIDEINKDFLLRKSLSYVDVLIDGRYEKDKRISSGLRGSENQNILYFSDKIHPDELMIDQEIEVGVSCDKIYVTGFPNISRKVLRELGVILK